MAHLIQAADVEAARRHNQAVLPVPPGALVTPYAAERARDLGVRLVRPGEQTGGMVMCRPGDSCGCAGQACGGTGAAAGGAGPGTAVQAGGGAPKAGPSAADVRRVVSAVILRVMPDAFSPVLVRQVTERVLQQLSGGAGGR